MSERKQFNQPTSSNSPLPIGTLNENMQNRQRDTAYSGISAIVQKLAKEYGGNENEKDGTFLDEENYCRKHMLRCEDDLPYVPSRRTPVINGFQVYMPNGDKLVITTGLTTILPWVGISGAVTITTFRNDRLIGSKVALVPEEAVKPIHEEIRKFLSESGLPFREVDRHQLFDFLSRGSKEPELQLG